MGQRPLLCPLHGARCDATPARTCITMSRYEAQYGTGGLIPASTLTLIIPESSSDLYEDLLSLPPSVPSALGMYVLCTIALFINGAALHRRLQRQRDAERTYTGIDAAATWLDT